MNVLVTGGAGFIGSHLAEAYLRDGHRVAVVDDLSSGKFENVPEGARFYPVDIRNKAALASVFAVERPELVNHHAAQMSVKCSTQDPSLDATINVMGLLNVLSLSKELHVKHLIFSSSGGTVYGDARTPTSEEHPLKPRSPYGITKMVAEHYLRYFGEQGLPYTIFRYGNVYGPRQLPHGEAGVIAIFIERMLDDQPVEIHWDGLQVKDYVFVEDVVRANLLVTEHSFGKAFNIGGTPASVNILYDRLSAIHGGAKPAIYLPMRDGDVRESVLDLSRSFRELGWQPKVTLEEGLKSTYHYMKGLR